MNKEEFIIMLKKNKEKIVIIFVVLLSLLVFGQFGYRFFCFKDEEIETKIDDFQYSFQYEVKDIPEIARKDFLLFLNQIKVDEEKIFKEKKVDRQDIEKNIKILKEQGIWDGLCTVLDGVFFEEYYNSFQDSQKAFQLQLYELLKKVEKEEDLESFRKELEKLRQEHQKDTNDFAEFARRIQEEAKKPMPFFATWTGLIVSAIICPIISFFILDYYKVKQDPGELETQSLQSSTNDKKYEKKYWFNDRCEVIFFLLIIHSIFRFFIFPLINCLFSLKISFWREIYKHYFLNPSKLLFLSLSLFVTSFLFANKLVNDRFFYYDECKKNI